MNARTVKIFLRLLPRLKIWKREIFPARSAEVKIQKDYLTDSAIVMEMEAAAIFRKIDMLLLHEEEEIPVLCKRTLGVYKNNPDFYKKISGLFFIRTYFNISY